ncbi:hypothetical protein LTR62_002966 [Meristemomyces frigidus]|uniref:Large ribosomal subunit protein uL29m n=1 Tax=Meristemomyces frigidus TaxID=1508187 RepID=A0AAN7TQQ7_9PEZI|nr:hypothetical protein LTR62_002966 [Meristemomyces frigidus]
MAKGGQVYWSTFASLYVGSPPAAVSHLEDAVRSRNLGLYAHAEEMFGIAASVLDECPIISIELSILYERRGLEAEREKVLQHALDSAMQDHSVVPESVIHLLRIMKASCSYYTTGKLRPSLDVARSIQTWLSRWPASEYTDIMCTTYYHVVVKLHRQHSDWCTNDDGDLPATPDKCASSSIRYLRRLLMAQERPVEAGSLLRDESLHYTGAETLIPYQEFLARYNLPPMNGHEVICYRILSSKLFLAEALGELQRYSDGQNLIQQVKASCLPLRENATASSNPRIAILIKNAEPHVSDLEPSLAKLAQHLHVAEAAAGIEEWHIQRASLIDAYHLVDHLIDRCQAPEVWSDLRKRRDTVVRALLEFEIRSGLGPTFLAATLMTTEFDANVTARSTEGLEYLSIFEELYPEFDVPLIGFRLYANAYTAALEANDETMAKKYLEKRQRFYQSTPGYKEPGRTYVYGWTEDETFLQDWHIDLPGMTAKTSFFQRRLLLSCFFLVEWVSGDLGSNTLDDQTAKVLVGDMLDRPIPEDIKLLDINMLAAAVYGTRGHARAKSDWQNWFQDIERWLRRTDLPPSALHRHYLLFVIAWCRGMMLDTFSFAHATSEEELEYILDRQAWHKECRRILESIDPRLDVTWQERAQLRSTEATHLIMLAINQTARDRGLASVDTIDQAIAMKRMLLEEYVMKSQFRFQYWNLVATTRALIVKYRYFNACPMTMPLSPLKQCDDLYRQMVSDFSSLSSFKSFWAKNQATEELDHAQTLRYALECSFQGFVDYIVANPNQLPETADWTSTALHEVFKTHIENVVDWSQRVKARSLTDIMGLGASIPESLLDRARQLPEAIELMQKYMQLNDRWRLAQIPDKMSLREEMRSLENVMRSVKELKPIMDISEGVTITQEELVEMCRDFQEDVFFVDYVHVKTPMSMLWDLAIVLYKNGIVVNILIVQKLKLEDVENWVRANLEEDERLAGGQEDLKRLPLNNREARKRLRQLCPLVENLPQFVQPGQLLVISPTLALYRLPFHAIPCDGQYLIERNPIVYCQSLTILRLCLNSRYGLQETVPEVLRPAVFNPLDDELATKQIVDDIAALLGTIVHSAKDHTKEQFIEQISDASLIHFHGHVRFDETDPLAHHLELSPTLNDVPTRLTAEKILTAKEIFDVSLKPGAHITTASCKSARAKISAANEQLGLLTAFHYAGASSVISTLWNIHRDDGAGFAQAFYYNLLEDLHNASGPGGIFADMARAMQGAILYLMRDKSGVIQSPYHWAGFIFNGAWLFPRPRWVTEARSEPEVSTVLPVAFLLPAFNTTPQSAPFSATTAPQARKDGNRNRGVSALRHTGIGKKQYLRVKPSDLPEPVLDPLKRTRVEVDENHPLWDFFYPTRDPDHLKRELIQSPDSINAHGRGWTVPELRLKDWDDLHRLWWVCVKERNRSATQELARQQVGGRYGMYGDYESNMRRDEVNKTMKCIKFVLTERFYAWENARVSAMEDEEVDLEADVAKGENAYLPGGHDEEYLALDDENVTRTTPSTPLPTLDTARTPGEARA